jgi:ribulose-phosphate 3-epimerase
MVKISVSILSIKDNVIDSIKKLNKTDTDYIHLDIMDGKFVSNKTYTFGDIKKLTKYIDKKLDVHLMVKDPSKYISDYATLNVDFITIHYEIGNSLERAIEEIKNCGIKCGVSIKPETNVEQIFPLLKDIDLVLIMSVNPGMGGQEFIPSTLDKIKALKEEIDRRNLKVIIEVDGGINNENAPMCIQNGTDILVSGSYIIKDENYQNNINNLKNN